MYSKSLDGEQNELAGYAVIGDPQQNDILIFSNGYWVYNTLSGSGSIVGISNVGIGAGIFRDIVSGTAFFRSLVSSNITIAVAGDNIGFSINPSQPDIRQLNSATNSLDLLMPIINVPNLNAGSGSPTYFLGWGSGGVIERFAFSDVDITDIQNVGTGAQILKNISAGIAYLRSITTDENILKVQNTDDIGLSINPIQSNISQISSGSGSFTVTAPTINFSNIPFGAGLPTFIIGLGPSGGLQKFTAADNDIVDVRNVGTGAQVLRNILSDVAYLRSLVGDPNIGIFPSGDNINFTLSNSLTGISEIAGSTLSLSSANISLPLCPAITPAYTLGLDSLGKVGYFTDTGSGVNSISNLGIGQALFSNLTGGIAYFRSLANGTNINLTGDPDNVYVNLNSDISVNQLTAAQLNAPLSLNGFGTGTPNFYLASDAGNNLILASLPSSTNIYNADGALTGNRTLSGAYSLTLNPTSIAMPTANISMAGLASNASPASYVSMDGSGNLTKSTLPPSTNIYNSDGFLPANRLMLGNAFNLTLDDTNLVLPNNVNYVPENNNTIELKYLVFDASGNSKMMYCPNNSLSRIISISPIGGQYNACNFLVLTNVIGGGAPPSFIIDFYLNDTSFSANSSAMHWSFIATLNTFNGTGPMVIMPNHAVTTTSGYPLFIMQAEYVSPNNLYFYLINISTTPNDTELIMRVVGRGIGAGNTASFPLIYSTLLPSANVLPESTKMYFQGNSGTGNIANWVWFYNLFPRNIKLSVWMSSNTVSSNQNYTITVRNNGIAIASILGRTSASAASPTIVNFVNTYNAYTYIPSGVFTVGANTLSFIIPAAISRTNMPFSISIELI